MCFDKMDFDIEKILSELATERPVFHNERDFQFSLALKIKEIYPKYEVRLEKFLSSEEKKVKGRNNTIRKYIDIVVIHKESKKYIPIELKYKTLGVDFIYNDEKYNLQNHGAQDYGCYSVLSDVSRIENLRDLKEFCQGYSFEKGYAILISNDRHYENKKTDNIFSNYWLSDSEIEKDEYKCGRLTFCTKGKDKEKTCAKGFDEITIQDKYILKWKPYSNIQYSEALLPTQKNKRNSFIERRRFRRLVLEIIKK